MQPNLIYILADDMGYGDLSCLNPESKIRTTHLDRLAAGGMRFSDAHASSAVCTPSRYSILTGRYNWRSALKKGVTNGYSEHLIEAGRLTVASLLKQHGYTTAAIGKWHLGWDWAKSGPAPTDVDFTKPIAHGPCNNGFDYFFGISASLDMPPYVYIENDRVTAPPNHEYPGTEGCAYCRRGPMAANFQLEDVLPELTRRAKVFIERQTAARPFFLYFPLPAPHTPILPTPEFQGKSGTNPYGDFCLMVDDVVGRVMAAVECAGLTEKTIIVLTADNGCSPMADFPALEKLGHRPSHVFRGHKADIYEGGHRIPLLIRWPAGIRAGSVAENTVCLVDLLATMAEIVGVRLPDNAGEDSVSLLPTFRDPRSTFRTPVVHHSIDGSFSIRQGRWKLELCPGSGGWSSPKPGKECEGLPPIQLYDLNADIGERRNVQHEHPEVVAELTGLLTRYVREGRSTPGKPQRNTGPAFWPQLNWMQP